MTLRIFPFLFCFLVAQMVLVTEGHVCHAMNLRQLWAFGIALQLAPSESFLHRSFKPGSKRADFLGPPASQFELSSAGASPEDNFPENIPIEASGSRELFGRSDEEIRRLIDQTLENSKFKERLESFFKVDLSKQVRVFSGSIQGIPRKVFFLDFPSEKGVSTLSPEVIDSLSACYLRAGFASTPAEAKKSCDSVAENQGLNQSLLRKVQSLDAPIGVTVLSDMLTLAVAAYFVWEFGHNGVAELGQREWVLAAFDLMVATGTALTYAKYLQGVTDPNTASSQFVELDKTREYERLIEVKKRLVAQKIFPPKVDQSKIAAKTLFNRRYDLDLVKTVLTYPQPYQALEEDENLKQILVLVKPEQSEKVIQEFLAESQFEEIAFPHS